MCIQTKIVEAIKNKQSVSTVKRDWTWYDRLTLPLTYSKSCGKCFDSVPTKYYCFCGKEENPEFDPWLPPHTCGNLCGRILPCGHQCNERCHAGRCPPCPRVITIQCPCGKTQRTVRCSMKHLQTAELLCHDPCLKLLSCGIHRCHQPCHFGPCPPCEERVSQTCYCGRESRSVPCGSVKSSTYSCGQICGKPLDCGFHHCEKLCHEGECGPCPYKPPRSCFCGKKRDHRNSK